MQAACHIQHVRLLLGAPWPLLPPQLPAPALRLQAKPATVAAPFAFRSASRLRGGEGGGGGGLIPAERSASRLRNESSAGPATAESP